ncbi:MAG: tRNA pseudouridine(55) synthase TruB [Anaerolineales bacterium]|nr:tRNA pseudouridine(55) synthase TruB [Anaerolineales bacterium]
MNIDKPVGMTSHDVVAVIRRGTHIKKVGHAGTLDPLATGILIVCVDKATRLSEFVMAHTKTYEADIHLGIETDTYDVEGSITRTDERPISRQQFEVALMGFVGDIQQIPPMYSAIKQDGKKLYDLARQGQTVDRPARPVTIYTLELLNWSFPHAHVRVVCTAGTYIRSLAYDIGQGLGVGAHLANLRRTQSGNFDLANAVPLDTLREAMAAGDWERYLLSPEVALADLPRVNLSVEQSQMVQQGRFLALDCQGAVVRAYDSDGLLIALLEPYDSLWKPMKVLV